MAKMIIFKTSPRNKIFQYFNTVDYDLAELEQRQYSNQYQSLTRYSPV